MERGVVVGGLMICGSFLLAASLNRSAVKETPRAEPPAAVAITPPLPAVGADEPQSAECAPPVTADDQAIATAPPGQGDLQGNGPKDCSQ